MNTRALCDSITFLLRGNCKDSLNDESMNNAGMNDDDSQTTLLLHEGLNSILGQVMIKECKGF